MGEISDEIQDRKNLKWASIHFSLFVVLIIAGIVVKRVFGHPEFMMLFHGPAAVFLVIAGMKCTEKQRRMFKRVE